MKITQTDIRYYIGNTAEQVSGKAAVETGANHLFAGTVADNLNMQIAGKKEEAMQKARKILGDVFSAEKSVDDDLKERANRIKESEQRIVDANKELRSLREEQESLKEQYGITEDSTQQQELELLKKRQESQKVNSSVVLTKEETEQLAAIDERGMTEYQTRYFELESYGQPYRETIAEAQDVIKEETAIIQGIKQERLKSCPMVEASKDAEEVMESANKEIISMMMDEVKETIDEKAEENKEKQEQLEEKKELEEAKREKREEEDDLEVPTQELLELNCVQKEMKREIDTMLTDMKLLAEDIKGSMVDTEL